MNEPKTHILVVDDDDRLRSLLGRYLREHAFHVSLAENASIARKMLDLFVFDLMVLDVMMPGETGLEFADSEANSDRLPPILVLSALTDTQDRIKGLEVGADDYLTKPFEPQELLLRIRAILRRTAIQKQRHNRLKCGPFTYDLTGQVLYLEDEPVHLTTNESALLYVLAQEAGRPVSRRQLAQQLGLEDGSERAVDVQVARLRKKMDAGDGAISLIQAVRGEGYCLQVRS